MDEITGVELIEQKWDELRAYIVRLANSWRSDDSRVDDIIQSTMERLLRENARNEFDTPKRLWGRATNIVREEIAQTFADRLPVSGVKFQAHWTATKALQRANGDPKAAYYAQEGTSRVGRELIFAVAGGPSLYSPEYLSQADVSTQSSQSSLTTHDEDNIRVAISELDELEQQVVRMRMWLRLTNAQVAQELGISTEKVRKTWSRAMRQLKPLLEKSLSDRFTSDM